MREECRGRGDQPDPARRKFLLMGAGAVAGIALFDPVEALAANRAMAPRKLSLLNLHTGERLTAEYWDKGRYLGDALSEINHILRDHRTDERHPIDPKLLDLVHTLHARMGGKDPVHVICGYRSPATNAQLRRNSGGVARNSLHMRGMAIDIRMPRHDTRKLYRMARSLRQGGVGYYRGSNFVHVDVGSFRTWEG